MPDIIPVSTELELSSLDVAIGRSLRLLQKHATWASEMLTGVSLDVTIN